MADVEVKATEAPKAKRKRLSKEIDGTILTIKEGTTDTVLKFNFLDLPEGIQSLFGPFGLSHKLGDAAAGKKGQDAIVAINKVWDGLLAGNWSVRAPAAEKITKKSITSKFEDMPEGKEKELAAKLLKKLGIVL